VDISTTMADLARRRLARWGDRTEVRRTTGAMDVPAVEASCDRFIACYVLDLLGEDDIRALIAEARRVLVPSGLLCATGLTPGRSVPARLVMGAWQAVHRLNPKLVGGCRPVEVRRYLSEGAWRIRHHEVVARFGISSEVLVAARL
jgi:ubiquinone/menaquinone biosynthesis C-methylase UbiE